MSVFDERKQTFKNKTSAATTTLISVTVSCLPFLFSHELGQLTVKWMGNRGRFRPSSRRRSRCPPGHDTRVQLVSASESGSAKSRRFQRDFLESVDRFFDSGIEGWWWLVRHVFVVLEKEIKNRPLMTSHVFWLLGRHISTLVVSKYLSSNFGTLGN